MENLVKAVYEPEEIAAIMGIASGTVYKCLRENTIPHRKMGKRYIISKDAFDRWFAEYDRSITNSNLSNCSECGNESDVVLYDSTVKSNYSVCKECAGRLISTMQMDVIQVSEALRFKVIGNIIDIDECPIFFQGILKNRLI